MGKAAGMRTVQDLFIVIALLVSLCALVWSLIPDAPGRPAGGAVVVLGERAVPSYQVRVMHHPLPTRPSGERNLAVAALEEDLAELDRCIRKMTKNWKREIDGRTYYGYDEELDRAWKERLWSELRAGEGIC
ncbi:hypothetical protein JXB02_04535 [Candidatus Woesearchaeota archaeon]|nr:hypothetical protein [Candidatus Woesearchaeota archaeon]